MVPTLSEGCTDGHYFNLRRTLLSVESVIHLAILVLGSGFDWIAEILLALVSFLCIKEHSHRVSGWKAFPEMKNPIRTIRN